MCSTCKYAEDMSKMIQIRHVPEKLHRTLKSRAALAGKSLTDYLLGELEKIAARPTLAELHRRIRSRPPVKIELSVAQILREQRGN